MAENQTRPTTASVFEFIDEVADEQKRKDSHKIYEMMSRISGFEGVMWGPAIIGFGQTHYKYESGREGDMPLIAFSPRKQSLTLYIEGIPNEQSENLAKLGKHSTSKVCLYIKRLSDVDLKVLEQIIKDSLRLSQKA